MVSNESPMASIVLCLHAVFILACEMPAPLSGREGARMRRERARTCSHGRERPREWSPSTSSRQQAKPYPARQSFLNCTCRPQTRFAFCRKAKTKETSSDGSLVGSQSHPALENHGIVLGTPSKYGHGYYRGGETIAFCQRKRKSWPANPR